MTCSALSASLVEHSQGLSHQSDAGLQHTLGRGKFSWAGDHELVPLKPLRDNLRLFRLFMAFPVAVTQGFVFRCFVCGNSCCRLTGDACLKAFRYAVGSSDEIFGLPNFVLASPAVTEAAVEALQMPRADREPSPTCCGTAGNVHFKAAEGRGARQPICQHGVYACTCSHGCCEIAFEMHRPESISGHQLLGLIFAIAKGCAFFLNDVMCILRAHIQAQAGQQRDLAKALLAILTVDSAESSSAAASSFPSVSLRLAVDPAVVGRLAEFVLECVPSSGTPLPRASPGASAGGVPRHPSDYDLSQLVWRLLERALHDPVLYNKIVGAIPAFHAFLHQCAAYLGAYATPGVGSGHELSEHLNAQTLSRNAGRSQTMTGTNWRLFQNTVLALFNQKRARNLAHGLLVQYIRALLSLQRRSEELEDLRAVSTERDVSDAALERASTEARALAARDLGRSAGAAIDAGHPARVRIDLSVKSANLAAAIRYFEGVCEIVRASPGNEDAKSAMLVTVLAGSPISLPGPSMKSLAAVDTKLASMRRSLSSLQKKLAGFSFDATSAVVVYLSQLHDLSTEFARVNQRIELHSASAGSAGTESKALYKARADVRKKMEHCVGLLKQLGAVSSDAAIHAAIRDIPDVRDISGPDCLPSRVGRAAVIRGDVGLAKLIDAFNARRAARDELGHVSGDVGRASSNVNAVILQLSSMLESLARFNGTQDDDLKRGAGASGLWGGLKDAMFDLSRSFPSVSSGAKSPPAGAASKRQLAAGMASHVAEGLALWHAQLAQLTVLQGGIELLPIGPCGYVKLKLDAKKRAHAFRYGRRFLSGELSPETWAAVSTGGLLPPRRERVAPGLIAVNSALPHFARERDRSQEVPLSDSDDDARMGEKGSGDAGDEVDDDDDSDVASTGSLSDEDDGSSPPQHVVVGDVDDE